MLIGCSVSAATPQFDEEVEDEEEDGGMGVHETFADYMPTKCESH